jgi:hypothetical protein
MSFIIVHDPAGRIIAMGEVDSYVGIEGGARPKDPLASGTGVAVVPEADQYVFLIESLDECHSDKLEDIVDEYSVNVASRKLVRRSTTDAKDEGMQDRSE